MKYLKGDRVKIARDDNKDYGHYLGKDGIVLGTSIKMAGLSAYRIKLDSDPYELKAFEADLDLIESKKDSGDKEKD